MEILNRFKILISRNWFRGLIQRHPGRVGIVTAMPQDEKRLSVPKSTAKIHISNLINFVQGIPTELVLNADEASSSEWEEEAKKGFSPICQRY